MKASTLVSWKNATYLVRGRGRSRGRSRSRGRGRGRVRDREAGGVLAPLGGEARQQAAHVQQRVHVAVAVRLRLQARYRGDIREI